MTGSDGKPVSDRSKNVEIWRSDDGSWKCVFDTWDSDLPPLPPPGYFIVITQEACLSSFGLYSLTAACSRT
jgi:hypothetical protein